MTIPRTTPRFIPRSLCPTDVTAIIDSRELSPLDLSPLNSVVGSLDTGNYSIQGLEHVVRIERKSLQELRPSIGRRGFERNVGRLLTFPVGILVVETSWQLLKTNSRWPDRGTRPSVFFWLLNWMAAGLSVNLVGDRSMAECQIMGLLYTVARQRQQQGHRELIQAFGQCEPSAEVVA